MSVVSDEARSSAIATKASTSTPTHAAMVTPGRRLADRAIRSVKDALLKVISDGGVDEPGLSR
jgi:hypothetical protein